MTQHPTPDVEHPISDAKGGSRGRSPHRETATAFTLIELLVVIAVIGILAGLLFTVMPAVGASKNRAIARSEMGAVEIAIESYKAHYGYYPPDTPNNPARPPLYYELGGTLQLTSPPGYRTLDGSQTLPVGTIMAAFGRQGFLNSSVTLEGTDEKPGPKAFLRDVKSTQLVTNMGVRLLASSVGWDGPGNNPTVWRYNSSNPTNNPGAYDLWVDLYLRDRTNQINNWK